MEISKVTGSGQAGEYLCLHRPYRATMLASVEMCAVSKPTTSVTSSSEGERKVSVTDSSSCFGPTKINEWKLAVHKTCLDCLSDQ